MAEKKSTSKKVEAENMPNNSLLAELHEAQARLADAQAKLNQKKKDAFEAIQKIEKESGLFCGVLLKREDLMKAFELMLQTGKDVKIPFQVYGNS